MLHECNIHCHSIDIEKADALGIDDNGKWLPFIFHLGIVIGAKMTSDEEEEPTFNCTSVFTENGDSYIIDTPYAKFNKIWKEYETGVSSSSDTLDL